MKLRFTPALGALAACLGAAAIVSACDASSTEGDIPPLTGVRIDTLGLLGGDSCGTADGQIEKLAVLLEVVPPPDPDAAVPEPEPAEPVDAAEPADASAEGGSVGAGAPPNGAPLSRVDRSAFFDCFAEPTFLSDAPVYATFRLRVFGFSAAAFAASVPAGAIDPTTDADLAAGRDEALAKGATVVATCVATQQANVRATAVCTLDRDSRSGATPAPDAGPSDAGDDGDAGSSDAGDAGDASTGDAGDAGEPTDAGTDAGDGGR